MMFSFAQENDSKPKKESKVKSKYGIRAATNISILDFEKPDDVSIPHNHRNGWAFGFFGEFMCSNNLGLYTEILFSTEGAKQEELRVDFLEMPIMLRYKIGERVSLNLGPQVNLKIHEYEDGYKNFTFSGLAGIEFMVTKDIFIDARYNYGFMNVFDDDTNVEAMGRNMQFGVGFKL